MKQGRMWLASAALMGLALTLAASHAGAAPSRSSRATQAASAADAAPRARSGNGLRQFTGMVSAVDKTSLTVERGGKKPQSRVFLKDEACRTTGEIAKDVRVTVYYRDEDGKAIAHRIVAKPSRGGGTKRG